MSRLSQDVERLRARGISLPQNPRRAAAEANGMMNMARQAQQDLSGMDVSGLRARAGLGRPLTEDDPQLRSIQQNNEALRKAMANGRGLGARMASGTGMGGDLYAAMPRFYDPLEYWDLSGLPWNTQDESHRHKLHKWLRLYYATHYLVPTLVDIFTRFPLVGMHFEHKDPELQDLYSDVFLNQLDYEKFMVSLGREFWTVGEAFPLGSFNEHLGVWEREELINPEDVVIQNFDLLGSQTFKIVPPDYLKRLVQLKDPSREYRMLEINFPELIPYLKRGEHIPISSVLLRQVGNKLTDWDEHGTPILLRGLRTLLHEERLLASQDAIAERLYSPLILATLGPQDLGDNMPPIRPTPEDLEAVRDDFDMALASDFRLIVHHSGLEVNSVFGREAMPRLGDDFDRIERRLMQVFGVNPSLLSAGSATQPYASSALQAEFLNQVLKTYQNALKEHYKERALVMAEALGHQEYEKRGKTRIPLFEEVVVYDEEGNPRVEERPKYTIPDLEFESLDLRDEATQRQYLMNLRQMGIPIPDNKLMVGIDWKPEDMTTQVNEDLKNKTIAQQQAKMDVYTALQKKNLPIPFDLKQEVESALQPPGAPGMGGAPPMGPGGPMGGPGGPPMGGGAAMAPIGGPGGIVMPGAPSGLGPGMDGGTGTVPGGGAPPAGPVSPMRGTVPEVSNERRPGLTYNTSVDEPAKVAAADDAEDDQDETPPTEWKLARNQELREPDEERELPQRIVVKSKMKKVTSDEAEGEKKYSIVDPEAKPPLEDDKEDSERKR
jgi:hypothetical protein